MTVYFEDGKTGGEEILNDILSGMNESLFESIFSFDMHGLQNIHQLGEADIGNYLFSASAVGSDALLQLDKKLEKKWINALNRVGVNRKLTCHCKR